MPGAARPAALPAADRLVVHPAVAADEHVVHRALAGARRPVRAAACASAPRHTSATRWLTSTLPAPTAAGGTRGDDRPARRDRPARGASRRRWPGSSGRSPTRSANATALTVTASTALTLPARCGVGAGEVERRARRRRSSTSTRCAVGDCCSGAGPAESSTSSKRHGRRAARRARRACGARRSRRPRRSGGRRAERRRSRTRSTPSRLAPRCASRSPRARRACASSRRGSRHDVVEQRTGGMRRPSWWISVASGGIEPGAIPPTSAWWARFATQPTSRSSTKHGRDERDVVEVRAAGERVVEHDLVAGPRCRRRHASIAARDRRRHRAEVHGDVLGLHEQLAGGGEQRGRAVGALLDVRAVRGAPQHRAHLVGDAGEPRDQHLQRRRVERAHGAHDAAAAPTRRARAGSATQPSGTHTVQSGSATTVGTDDAACAVDAREVGRSSSGAAADARARIATTSTGAPGRA